MIPYYSPNFALRDWIRSLGCKEAEQYLTSYFQNLTGKKHVLFTSSCRSALFLAYKSLLNTGFVHTSPLTCRIALLPIIASGNKIIFSDIKSENLTIDVQHTKRLINNKSIAIQAIHFGGFACDLAALRKLADEFRIPLVEDCAQGFMAMYNGKSVGSVGDIACFTLSKNVYGLGGGVLATDNFDFFQRARAYQQQLPSDSLVKILIRTISQFLSSHRTMSLMNLAYGKLMKSRKVYSNLQNLHSESTIGKELRKPSQLYIKYIFCRLPKIETLNKTRVLLAQKIIDQLIPLGFSGQTATDVVSSYTKLFLKHPDIDSLSFITSLNLFGIEAMHLEHRFGVFYQSRFDKDPTFASGFVSNDYENYYLVHDRLVSLPLFEAISESEISTIVSTVKDCLQIR